MILVWFKARTYLQLDPSWLVFQEPSCHLRHDSCHFQPQQMASDPENENGDHLNVVC